MLSEEELKDMKFRFHNHNEDETPWEDRKKLLTAYEEAQEKIKSLEKQNAELKNEPNVQVKNG